MEEKKYANFVGYGGALSGFSKIKGNIEIKKSRRQPTLPRKNRSTIGFRALDFRVRDGNGYDSPERPPEK
jgi:hypothetical protein